MDKYLKNNKLNIVEYVNDIQILNDRKLVDELIENQNNYKQVKHLLNGILRYQLEPEPEPFSDEEEYLDSDFDEFEDFI